VDGVSTVFDVRIRALLIRTYGSVEISVGIIAASVPALYPLFVMFMRQSFESWAPKFTFRSHSTNTQIHDQPGRSDTLSKNSVPLEDMRGDNDDKKVVVCTVRRHSSVEPLYPPSLGPSMVDDKRSSGEN
jgi:hypothetical protein